MATKKNNGQDEVTVEVGNEVFNELQMKVELTHEYEGKVAAVGKKVAAMVEVLWLQNRDDIQRKLVETIIEAQRAGDEKVKYAVPMKAVFDLEKDKVEVMMQWRGPARKRGVKFSLSDVAPLLPGMEEAE